MKPSQKRDKKPKIQLFLIFLLVSLAFLDLFYIFLVAENFDSFVKTLAIAGADSISMQVIINISKCFFCILKFIVPKNILKKIKILLDIN